MVAALPEPIREKREVMQMVVKMLSGEVMDIDRVELVVSEVTEVTNEIFYYLVGYAAGHWELRRSIAYFDSVRAAVVERSRLQVLLDAENQDKVSKQLADLLGEVADGQ